MLAIKSSGEYSSSRWYALAEFSGKNIFKATIFRLKRILNVSLLRLKVNIRRYFNLTGGCNFTDERQLKYHKNYSRGNCELQDKIIICSWLTESNRMTSSWVGFHANLSTCPSWEGDFPNREIQLRSRKFRKILRYIRVNIADLKYWCL